MRTRSTCRRNSASNLARFTQFLTLVGLTALIVGGVGVANAVRATVERKRGDLAILKSLGAPGGSVFAIRLAEVLLVAGLGIASGWWSARPFPSSCGAVRRMIPFPLVPSIYPGELSRGALGVLTALAFSLAPLGRGARHPGLGAVPRRGRTRPAASAAPLIAMAVAAAGALARLASASPPTAASRSIYVGRHASPSCCCGWSRSA